MTKKINSTNMVHAFRDNFWSRKRVEAKFTIDDIAKYLGKSRAATGMYFTGQIMPPQDCIKLLCSLFGVDELEGEREFRKAVKAYDLLVAPKKAELTCNTEPVVEEDDAQMEFESIVEPNNDIFKLVYGKLSFEEFNTFFDLVAKGSNPLELIYGKVSFDEYKAIADVLKRR